MTSVYLYDRATRKHTLWQKKKAKRYHIRVVTCDHVLTWIYTDSAAMAQSYATLWRWAFARRVEIFDHGEKNPS